MSYFEYMVVPAPTEAPRKKGVKSTGARFAHGFQEALNRHAGAGWEFQRTETMTAEASRGFLRGKSVETVTMLVFRRWVELETEEEQGPSFADEKLVPQPEAPRQPAAKLRPVPEAEPPAEPVVAPGRTGAETQPPRDQPRRMPPLGANRRADLPLRPVPGPDRG